MSDDPKKPRFELKPQPDFIEYQDGSGFVFDERGRPKKRFITEADLELLTGVSRRTWARHRMFNRGPKFYKLAGAIRYDLAEVLAWIRAQGIETADKRKRA
jgi:hypothetical protein